jgi:hypothetical protein
MNVTHISYENIQTYLRLSITRKQYSIWPRIKSICHMSIVRLNHIFKIVNSKTENTKSERNKIHLRQRAIVTPQSHIKKINSPHRACDL